MDGLHKHLERLSVATNSKARSAPSLRQIQLVSPTKRANDIYLYGERTEHHTSSANPSGQSKYKTLKRVSSRQARDYAKEDEKFNRRIARAADYEDRKAMLAEKEELVQRLRTCHSVEEEVFFLRALGELYLTNAVHFERDAVKSEAEESVHIRFKKTAEGALMWLRRALERSNGADLTTWYLMGRAVGRVCS